MPSHLPYRGKIIFHIVVKCKAYTSFRLGSTVPYVLSSYQDIIKSYAVPGHGIFGYLQIEPGEAKERKFCINTCVDRVGFRSLLSSEGIRYSCKPESKEV